MLKLRQFILDHRERTKKYGSQGFVSSYASVRPQNYMRCCSTRTKFVNLFREKIRNGSPLSLINFFVSLLPISLIHDLCRCRQFLSIGVIGSIRRDVLRVIHDDVTFSSEFWESCSALQLPGWPHNLPTFIFPLNSGSSSIIPSGHQS